MKVAEFIGRVFNPCLFLVTGISFRADMLSLWADTQMLTLSLPQGIDRGWLIPAGLREPLDILHIQDTTMWPSRLGKSTCYWSNTSYAFWFAINYSDYIAPSSVKVQFETSFHTLHSLMLVYLNTDWKICDWLWLSCNANDFVFSSGYM